MDVAGLLVESFGRVDGLLTRGRRRVGRRRAGVPTRPGGELHRVAGVARGPRRGRADRRRRGHRAGVDRPGLGRPLRPAVRRHGARGTATARRTSAGCARRRTCSSATTRAVGDRTLDYLRGLAEGDLDRVVDEGWDPPVTLGVRLVSIVGDSLQHAGQAAYVRGLLEALCPHPTADATQRPCAATSASSWSRCASTNSCWRVCHAARVDSVYPVESRHVRSATASAISASWTSGSSVKRTSPLGRGGRLQSSASSGDRDVVTGLGHAGGPRRVGPRAPAGRRSRRRSTPRSPRAGRRSPGRTPSPAQAPPRTRRLLDRCGRAAVERRLVPFAVLWGQGRGVRGVLLRRRRHADAQAPVPPRAREREGVLGELVVGVVRPVQEAGVGDARPRPVLVDLRHRPRIDLLEVGGERSGGRALHGRDGGRERLGGALGAAGEERAGGEGPQQSGPVRHGVLPSIRGRAPAPVASRRP